MKLKPPTGRQLRALLRERGMRRREAAEILHVSKLILDRWCLSEKSTSFVQMPVGYWELLLLKLGIAKLERWRS